MMTRKFTSGLRLDARRRKLLLAALFLAILALAPLAAAQDEKPASPPRERGVAPADKEKTPSWDGVNLAYLGDKKPVLLRFHILIDGKTTEAHWNDYIEKWFRFLDVDNHGVLSEEELKLAPTSQAMQQLIRQGVFLPQPGSTLTPAKMGKARGDKVTLADLRRYYSSVAPPVQVVPQLNNDAMYAEASNALFKALDLNKDGKLSKEEILAARKTLRKLDLDDDECISVQELTPNFAFNSFPRTVGRGNPVNPGASQINESFYRIESAFGTFNQVLLNRYDKAKVQRLTRKDLGLDDKDFARLDKDSNGSLDQDELAHWHERPADLEFTIHLNTMEANPSSNDIFYPPSGVELARGRKAFLSSAKETNGAYQLALQDAQINLAVSDAGRQGGMVLMIRGQGNAYLQLFRQADVKKRGFVEMKDLENPQFIFLRQTFTFFDRDRDGKLTEKEIKAGTELLTEGVKSHVTVTVAEHGRALFHLLDVNHDGRLSQRELLNAWSRLEPLDKDRKGYITMADLSQQFQINVHKGMGYGYGNFVNFPIAGLNPGTPVQPPRLPENTPQWFRKMDKNGDGDVSRAEFLGTREEFDRIDTDHDGLISAEEAIRYDALMRKGK